MFRRRRPPREIAFSFDSFLDVVANVVGIILRLILVAWVGARAYKGPPPSPPVLETPEDALVVAPLPEPTDPLTAELEKRRRELVTAQAALLDQLRQWELTRQQSVHAAEEQAKLAARRRELAERRTETGRAAAAHGEVPQQLALSAEQLRERSRKLVEEISALQKEPSTKHTLRYRTPVSHPLQTEELVLECRRGHVSIVDVGGLLDYARRDIKARLEVLRTSWEMREVTPAVGAFRLRYVVERDRDLLDASGLAPSAKANFQAHMTYWEVEPTTEERGETMEQALASGSAFRRVMDALDANQTAVTFWVYPDSFALYRRLRDFLHDRDVVVAGRPLPEGHPIAFSTRQGSVSRGQ
jgi:hypothetical protein